MAKLQEAVYQPEPLIYSQRQEEKDYSWRDIVNGSVRRNVIFGEFLTNRTYGSGIPDPNFRLGDEKSKEIMGKYGVDIFSFNDTDGIASHFDLEQRLKQHKQRDYDAKAVESLGLPAQIAVEGLTSLFSVPEYAIGGLVGKGFKTIGKAMDVGSGGAKALSVGAGATSGATSMVALDMTTTGEIDPINAAIAGTIGATIGYFTGNGFISNPNTLDRTIRMHNEGVWSDPNNMQFYPKEKFGVPILHSSADLLKSSDNAVAREFGYKATRSMDGKILQTWNTAEDLKRTNDVQAISALRDVDQMRKDFKQVTGREFAEEDERAVMRIGNDIDFKYNNAKDAEVNKLIDDDIQAKIDEYSKQMDDYLATLDAEHNAKLQEVKKAFEDGLDEHLTGKNHGSTVDQIRKEADALKQNVQTAMEAPTKRAEAERTASLNEIDAKVKSLEAERASKIKEATTVHEEALQARLDKAKVGLTIEQIRSSRSTLFEALKKLRDTPTEGMTATKLKKHGIATRKAEKAVNKVDKILADEAGYNDKRAEILDRYNKSLSEAEARLNAQYDKIKQYLIDKSKKLQAKEIKTKLSAEEKKAVSELQARINKLEKRISDHEAYAKNRQEIIDLFQEKLNKKVEQLNKSHAKSKEEALAVREKEIKKIQDYKHTDVEIDGFAKTARETVSKRIDEIINAHVPKEYRSFVERMNKFHQYYGGKINSTQLDGITDLDTAFYWARNYDVKKILANEDMAVEAFARAIASNFSEVTEEVVSKSREIAREIVNGLVATSMSREVFGVPENVARKYLDNISKAGKLKSRKLKLNSAELVDFMDSSLDSYIASYHHSMNGRVAVKEIYGVDNVTRPDDIATKNGFNVTDRKRFNDVIKSALNESMLDPKADSMSSKILRSVKALNFLNFGGWFAPNTLTDLSNQANDFGLARTAKYFTKDVVNIFGSNDEGSKKFAHYFGLGGHSLMNDRAMLAIGGDAQVLSTSYDKMLAKSTSMFSKYSGLNMTIDVMDRTAALSATDFILTAKQDEVFTRTMNRLGLTLDDVQALRDSQFVSFKNGLIDDADFSKLDTNMRYKFERAVRRAADDTVIKADEMDVPEWMKSMFSPAVAQTVFQFLRFPILAHNRIGRKMYHNFSIIGATSAAVVGIGILSLVSQAKDIGKEKKRYDLDTEEGQSNFAKMVIEYTPALGAMSLVQMQYDVIGRMIASARDQEYSDRGHEEIAKGMTIDRLDKLYATTRNVIEGNATGRDASELLRWTSTNLFYINPFTNMMHDWVKENDEWIRND